MMEETRELRLHATIVNTIYAEKVHASRKLTQDKDGRFGVAEAARTGPEEKDAEAESGKETENEVHVDGGSQEDEAKIEPITEPPSGRRPREKGKRKKQPLKLDAQDLIDRYSEFEWARDVKIEKVAICEMGAKKITDEKGEVVGEEYTEVASVPFP